MSILPMILESERKYVGSQQVTRNKCDQDMSPKSESRGVHKVAQRTDSQHDPSQVSGQDPIGVLHLCCCYHFASNYCMEYFYRATCKTANFSLNFYHSMNNALSPEMSQLYIKWFYIMHSCWSFKKPAIQGSSRKDKSVKEISYKFVVTQERSNKQQKNKWKGKIEK